MAECIVLKGGGGADLDVVTAGKPDVLAGKVIVDKDGEPLTGTMPNRGAVNQALNSGGSYVIPEGYHTGTGKVSANSLASQTSGTATASHILSGQSAWVNGTKVNGGIPLQSGDAATDQAWATQRTAWSDGNLFFGVRNGYYLNGVNWIRAQDPAFIATNIKKGVNMWGITGTHEGYVPTSTDLYLRGNNPGGFVSNSDKVILESGQVTFNRVVASDLIYAPRDLTGYNYVNMEVNVISGGGLSGPLPIIFVATGTSNANADARTDSFGTGNKTLSLNISAINAVRNICVTGGSTTTFYLYRVWLS